MRLSQEHVEFSLLLCLSVCVTVCRPLALSLTHTPEHVEALEVLVRHLGLVQVLHTCEQEGASVCESERRCERERARARVCGGSAYRGISA